MRALGASRHFHRFRVGERRGERNYSLGQVADPGRFLGGNAQGHIAGGSESWRRWSRMGRLRWCLIEATDEHANAKKQWIVDNIDAEAVRNMVSSMTRTSAIRNTELGDDPYVGLGKDVLESFSIGFASPQLVGSPQTVTEKMLELKELGLESLLICFFDPQRGLHQMQDKVIPLLKKMGLRK
jgi:dimethylsulfone monooxygenase